MPDVLIRDLDATTLRKLKARAKRHRRSLQAEMKVIAEDIAGREPNPNQDDFWRRADEMRERLKGTQTTDSAEIIREFRDA